MKTNRRTCGTFYETKAADYLQALGYQILERNYHAGRYGEIDLIAYDTREHMLVFAEVKYRSSGLCGHPAEAVDRRKQETIRHCARCYLSEHPDRRGGPCRFDVLALHGPAASDVTHYRNAF